MIPIKNHSSSKYKIIRADCLEVLNHLDADSVDLIYIDPPFNTGREQSRTRIATRQDDDGGRIGFQGKNYRTVELGTSAFNDRFEDYIEFLQPKLTEAYRVLAPHGSFYLHIDYREVHYVKIMMDQIFGRDCFQNELIWAYDYGGKQKNKWPAKHDNILYYVKDLGNFVFNVNDIEREPYMAPGLVTPEKAERGKLPTDVWWHTIVPTNGRERTGYPTQKPLGILKRIISASSLPEDLVLDFFAGSGTTGEAALRLGRRFLLVDNNPEALEVMARRFREYPGIEFIGFASDTSCNDFQLPLL